MNDRFLPISGKGFDVIIVTGDAYCDHPSYGAAVIGRVLEDAGFRAGVIAQPEWKSAGDFKRLGRPRLFFAVTAGSLDSMVANYTANRKIRSSDDYSPGGRPSLRPDRATITYANRIKEAFPGVPVVIGGIEAGMRRLAHYDYWQEKVRRSVLLDSKADILVYGMGEHQVLEIARRLIRGGDKAELGNIRGTVVAKNKLDGLEDHVEIPSFEEVSADKDKFNAAIRAIYEEADPRRGRTIAQRHGDRFAVQYPPALPLTTEEMDKVYGLDYRWAWHPVYDKAGGVPGFETVRFSVISHRGCPGACSFCSLYLHQGRIVQSRSRRSIVEQIESLSRADFFRGTITDIGGPTANLYMANCRLWPDKGSCRDKNCMSPAPCGNLKLGYQEMMKLWKELEKLPKVKHVFVGSGVRYDLMLGKDSDEFFMELCSSHISGQLKVAPEHCDAYVLGLMNKTSFGVYEKFAERFREANRRLGKKQYLVHYFISAHPGATLDSALELSLKLVKLGIRPEQIQDFIPLPMTISGSIYYTGKDPFTARPVYVARGLRERKLQRAIIQYWQPQNRRYVMEALRKLGREDLAANLLGAASRRRRRRG